MSDIYQSVREHTIKIFAAIAQMMRRHRVEQREILFALHPYTPARGHTDQLAFVEGDEFILRSDADQKWWHVKHNKSGKKGYVPMSYVARSSEKLHMEWYDMRLSREDAERILKKEKYEPGSFIIRTKDNLHFSQALALTIKTEGGDDPKSLHYVITRESGEFRLGGGKPFPTLTQLVHYYAGCHSGLKQPLSFSVKKDKFIDVWEINPDDLVFDENAEPLGSGFFGKVHKGTMHGKHIAVKTMKHDRMTVEQFMREAEIARKFSHSNIVKTIGVCSKKPYIITEFLPGGNLKDYLQKTRISPDDFLPIAQKIASAMAHLEERKFVHRDLAARNILVGETHDVIKLADFGLARCLEESDYYRAVTKIFPFKWTAPEAFVIESNIVNDTKKDMGKSTIASDVWSYAVVLWELYSKGAEPYEGLSSNEIYINLTSDHYYRLSCPTGCAPEIYNKMRECWSLNPDDRPTFAQLKTFLLNPYGDAQ